MSLTPIFVLIGIFIIGLIVIFILYATKIGPYGQPYQIKDPRTWQSQTSNTAWLTPAFDYSPTDRNVPAPDIKGIYCSYDPIRCIPTQAQFDQTPVQTPC